MIFKDLNLPDEILRSIDEIGFERPTDIQKKAIPHILNGDDVMGKSRTGTGKTAAFSIPAIINVNEENRKTVSTLILCPTRELAMQVCDEIKKYSKYKSTVKVISICGGQSYDTQISGLKSGANIVVGTPGRIIDHIDRKTLKLNNINTIVLDEADEMLNMGFIDDIEKILQSSKEGRQVILFSATMPKDILNITKRYQKNPVIVDVNTKGAPVSLVEQFYCCTPRDKKLDTLYLLLNYIDPKFGIIFCNTRKMVDDLEVSLNNLGFNSLGLHGDMKQSARTAIMAKFKSGKIRLLIATDVAARGIDVSGVDVVFNYDLPQDIEYYVHRIGRTGRAGKSGQSFTLVGGASQYRDLNKIKKYTNFKMNYFKIPSPTAVIDKLNDRLIEKISKRITDTNHDNEVTNRIFESLLSLGHSVEDIAKSFIYDKLPNNTHKFPVVENISESRFKEGVPSSRGFSRNGRTQGKSKFKKLLFSIGHKHGVKHGHIIDAICKKTGMEGNNIGRISIQNNNTIVEIPLNYTDTVEKVMHNNKINNNTVSVSSYKDKPSSHFHSNRRKAFNKNSK